jgi:hypothetical protein
MSILNGQNLSELTIMSKCMKMYLLLHMNLDMIISEMPIS